MMGQPASSRSDIRDGEREGEILPQVEATVFLKLNLRRCIPSHLTFKGMDISLNPDKN